MTTTPNPTAEQGDVSYERLIRHLIAQLRQDAGDYAKVAQGIPMSHDLSWDARDVRAWDAATALEALLSSAAGLLGGDSQSAHAKPVATSGERVRNQTDSSHVAPQEPSPVASTPTVSDDSGHGGDDNRGGREDGPENEGRSHQATVAGTPQRPSGCAECHRTSGHKMDCSHRFAAQPMLDPEKVRLVIAHSVREGMKFGDLYRIADALCEAAKRGELT